MRLLLSALLLASCAAQDPLTRPGLWQPVGANDANLRAMLADPDDLQHGRADPAADGQVVAAAIHRYRTGTVKPLPDSSIAKVAPIATSAPAAAAAAAAPSGDDH